MRNEHLKNQALLELAWRDMKIAPKKWDLTLVFGAGVLRAAIIAALVKESHSINGDLGHDACGLCYVYPEGADVVCTAWMETAACLEWHDVNKAPESWQEWIDRLGVALINPP